MINNDDDNNNRDSNPEKHLYSFNYLTKFKTYYPEECFDLNEDESEVEKNKSSPPETSNSSAMDTQPSDPSNTSSKVDNIAVVPASINDLNRATDLQPTNTASTTSTETRKKLKLRKVYFDEEGLTFNEPTYFSSDDEDEDNDSNYEINSDLKNKINDRVIYDHSLFSAYQLKQIEATAGLMSNKKADSTQKTKATEHHRSTSMSSSTSSSSSFINSSLITDDESDELNQSKINNNTIKYNNNTVDLNDFMSFDDYFSMKESSSGDLFGFDDCEDCFDYGRASNIYSSNLIKVELKPSVKLNDEYQSKSNELSLNASSVKFAIKTLQTPKFLPIEAEKIDSTSPPQQTKQDDLNETLTNPPVNNITNNEEKAGIEVKTEMLEADKAISTNKNCTYEQTTQVSSSSQDQLAQSSSIPSSGVNNNNNINTVKSISPMSMSSNENITISMGQPPTTNGYMNTYFQSLTKLKPQNKSIIQSQIQKPKTVLLTNNSNINNINNVDMSTVISENQISPQGALGSLTSSSSSFLVKKPSQQTAPPSAQLINKSNNNNSSIQSYLNQSNNGKTTINEMKNNSNSSVCLTSSSSSPSSSSPSSKPINTSAGGLAQLLVSAPNGALPVNGSNQYQENQVTTTIKSIAAPKLFQSSVSYSQQTPSSSSTSSSSTLSNNNSNMVNNNINSNYNQLKLATSTSPTQVSDSNIVSSTSSSTGNDLNNKSK